MWKREIEGQVLTFHLAGINNQNFLMRDEETGSFWQQISGRAISGPLAGGQLTLVHSDELSFALWKAEYPNGTVLLPDPKVAKEYEPKDWDVKLAKVRSVVDTKATGHAPRELMLGIAAFGSSRAYPLDRVQKEKLIQDRIGGEPVIVVVGSDNKSVRAFLARLPGEGVTPEFYRTSEGRLIDSATGSEWNFQGCAVSGKAKGTCLKPVDMLKDYWFDWHNYNPGTTVYK